MGRKDDGLIVLRMPSQVIHVNFPHSKCVIDKNIWLHVCVRELDVLLDYKSKKSQDEGD